jgi:hypothetical protein
MQNSNTIANAAASRQTETLKEDIVVAYKNMKAKNNDITKMVYHTLFSELMGRLNDQEVDTFEATYREQ